VIFCGCLPLPSIMSPRFTHLVVALLNYFCIDKLCPSADIAYFVHQ
jgi:hypothetical protein